MTRTFAFLSSNIPVFVLMTAVVLVPVLLYQSSFLVRAEVGMPEKEFLNARLGLMGIYPLLTLLLQAAATLAVFQHLRGRPVHLLASIRRGLVALLPIIVTAVLLLLLFGLAIVLGSIPAKMAFAGIDQEGTLKTVKLAITLIAFVWIGSLHLVCIQALVVERLNPIAARIRSRILTRGSQLRIAGLLVLTFVARWLLTFALYPAIIDTSASWDAFKLALYVDAGLNSLFVVFIAVCGAVIYCDLRRAKNGIDVDELTRVFEG